MMTVPITLVSIAPHQWPGLLDALQDDLLISKNLAHPHLRKSVRVVRAANFTLRDRDHAKSLHFKSRRIWLGIQLPGSSKRKVLPETHEALQVWKDVLIGTPFLHHMIPPTPMPLHLSISGCLCYCDRSRIRWHPSCEWGGCSLVCVHEHAEAQQFFPWISDSMQKHINAWELLGQFSLAYCLHHSFKGGRSPIAVTFACDNTSAEAAHLKALSTSAGMCQILEAFFRFQRVHNIEVAIQHIPGMWNDEADALSRGRSLLCCPPEIYVAIPWKWLCSSIPEHAPSQAKIPHTRYCHAESKIVADLHVEHRDAFGGFDPSVDVSILFGCPKPQF
jgi:hypothetical protein